MLKRVEILLDVDLVEEIIRRYHVADAREAVNLAMRALIDVADNAEPESRDEDYDEFSDLSAWSLHREQRHRLTVSLAAAHVIWRRCAPGCTLFLARGRSRRYG